MRENVGLLLDQLEQLYRQFIHSKIFQNNQKLTLPDLRALEYVYKVDRCNMKDLVSELSVAASTATGIVTRLVNKNLVKRSQDPKDKRMVFLEITTRGQNVHQNLRKQILNEAGKVLSIFQDQEIEVFSELVDKLTYSLNELN